MSEASFAQGLVGVTLDQRYRLDALLGEGGMGAVFRATHLAMERKVAIKLLKPHLTSDATQLQRFVREARSTHKVDSPHAVKVLDFGVTPHRDYYIVLEYLDGRTVQRELEVDGPFAPRRVVHIAQQSLHALAAAHKSGLVHRDIKPDNLLLMRVGADPDYTKVLDFGVAKLMEGAAQSDQAQLALTQIGVVFGTPEFMSPEQACGQPLDARSDLYSLAVTMFVMLTGSGLFEGKSPLEWLTHHARTPAPRLAMVRPELAAYGQLDDLLQRCLAKQRDSRPRTAEELQQLLAAVVPSLDGDAPPRTGTLAPTQRERSQLSASAYLRALPAELIAAGPARALPDAASSGPGAPLATTTSALRAVAPRRRGLVLALAALGVIATIGVAVALAVRRETAAAPAAIDAPADAAAAESAGDAGPPRRAVDAIAGGLPGDRPPPPVPGPRPPVVRNAAADEHLRNAEEALRSGNRLRQLAEADLALRAAPRSARAKFLLGDALLKSGDMDRGCKYLRQLGASLPARRRARAAGCPTD